jgi:cobalt/nickel transport system permease protein
MFYSLKLRSIGKNNRKYTSVPKIMGNLFLKSNEMGEEMYSAMECRGFTGEYTTVSNFKITVRDVLYASASVLLIVFYFYTKGLKA